LFFLLLDIEELLRFRPSAESLFFLLNFMDFRPKEGGEN